MSKINEKLTFSNILSLFFKLLLPVAIILFIIRFFIYFKYINIDNISNEVLKITFTILLSAIIGYWTNFMAIKMLFKPQEPKLFGLVQGVIPRNKQQLAEGIGNGIKDTFFKPKQIIDFIEKDSVLNKLRDSVKEMIQDYLKDENNKEKIVTEVNKVYNQNKHKLREKVNSFIKTYIIDLLSNELELRKTLTSINYRAEGFINKNDTFINIVAEMILLSVEQNSKEIENLVREIFSKGFTQIFIDPKKEVERLINYFKSDKGKERISALIKGTIPELSKHISVYASKPETKENIGTISDSILEIVDENIISEVIAYIKNKLSDYDNWDIIMEDTISIANEIINYIEEFLKKESSEIFIKNIVNKSFDTLEINKFISKQLETYDTDELERLLNGISGKYLRFIEISGGVLGGLLGLLFLFVKWL